jgi:hypothetical protein
MEKCMSNVYPHPNSEALEIMAALRTIKVVSKAHQRIAVVDNNVLRQRAWLAVEAIIDHAEASLCARAGMVQS